MYVLCCCGGEKSQSLMRFYNIDAPDHRFDHNGKGNRHHSDAPLSGSGSTTGAARLTSFPSHILLTVGNVVKTHMKIINQPISISEVE